MDLLIEKTCKKKKKHILRKHKKKKYEKVVQ